jgi:uncharacterized membrane protein YgcG
MRRFIAKSAALSLLLSTAVSVPAQTATPQSTSPKTTAVKTTKAPATQSRSATTINIAFPRTYKTPKGGRVILYSPQVSEWPDQKHIVAYSAVSYLASGAQKSVLGTIRVEGDTSVSLEEHLVQLSPLKITESNFGALPKEQVTEIVTEIANAIPQDERVFSLERVLAFVDSSQIIPKNTEGMNTAPPTIFVSKKPAIIVNFDGEPIWSPIKENDLKFAVNTNWDLFQYQPENTYYLRNNDTWLKASDIKGPWQPAGKLPKSFSKLPADENFTDVIANVPGKETTAAQVPHVFVSMQPAEMILLTGEPTYQPVTGTSLLWVSNTESDLFREGQTGPFYYLVTGRWWRAYDLNGPWTFATPTLPADFKKISLEHPRSRVLASVPGTQQAAEAIILASIPQTARIKKSEIKAPEVIYQGEPQFQAIDTTMERAVNTDKDVIKVRGVFYLCYEGVWFMSNAATGPWTVASSVPPEIYGIPSSSPAHNVTYVTTKEDEDSEWVDVAVTAGYTGMMIGWGCAMWGTGWYYPPYYWYGGYYPYFHTYGAAAWYNPANGAFGVAGGIYGPYGGVSYGARYNPSTGTYMRGARAYGPYGSRGYGQAYNPRTGTYGQTRSGSNVYGSWRSSYVQRGDDWVSTKKYTDRATGDTTRVTRTDEGGMIRRKGDEGSGFVGKSGDDVYAGKDGNVYRKDENGNWSKWENGGWNQVEKPDRGDRPSQLPSDSKDVKNRDKSDSKLKDSKSKMDSSTFDRLEKDSSARKSGKDRADKYGSYKSSRTPSSSRSMGSFGGSRGGGGFRGGGGRRR